MRFSKFLPTLGLALALLSNTAAAGDYYPHYPAPNCPPGHIPHVMPGHPHPLPVIPSTKPEDKDPKKPDEKVQPPDQGQLPDQGQQPGMGQPVDAGLGTAGDFAAATPAGTEASGSFDAQMIGDLGLIGATTIRTSSVSSTSAGISSSGIAQVPIPQGSFKIAENESPRPTDRFYLGYNRFNEIITGPGGAGAFDLNIYTIGFEKTIMNGNASLGIRVPFLNTDGGPDVDGIGNLTGIFKWALLNDPCTRDVFSLGLAVTAPTGDNLVAAGGGDLDTVYLQPFLGYIFHFNRCFVQGFSSINVPTEDIFPTFLSNDIGLGYLLVDNRSDCNCNGGLISYLIPSLEAHITTPLDNEGLFTAPGVIQNQVLIPNVVIMTAGAHIGLGERLRLTIAGATPVTGPRIFQWEGVVQLNFLF